MKTLKKIFFSLVLSLIVIPVFTSCSLHSSVKGKTYVITGIIGFNKSTFNNYLKQAEITNDQLMKIIFDKKDKATVILFGEDPITADYSCSETTVYVTVEGDSLELTSSDKGKTLMVDFPGFGNCILTKQ